MLAPSEEMLREWSQSSARFPEHLVPVERDLWPEPSPHGGIAVGAFRSREFVVVAWKEPTGFTRLSINRTEWDDQAGRFRGDIGWDDLQRLKAEAGFGDATAVEIYPPDDQVINTANLRHLFILPSPPAFMWAPLSEAA